KKHLEKHNMPTLNDFYFHMGETKSKVEVIIAKVKIEQEKNKVYEENKIEDFIKEPVKKKSAKKDDQGIVIDGTENTLIRFARCCTPLPGDDIGGYVTKLTGIAIHRKDCPNYLSMVNHDAARVIDVNWDEKLLDVPAKKNKYIFVFTIRAVDRQSILMDVVTTVSNHKINVLSLNSHNIKKGLDTIAVMKVTVELNNKDEYKQLVNHLLKIKDVISVDR
ncbi:MAG: ACT domain-containing protein, partial [Cetobacterium sp.]